MRSPESSSAADTQAIATSQARPMFRAPMSILAFLSNLAGPDLVVILLIILVLFGAKRLPELARGMGQAMKEFNKAKDEFTDQVHGAGKPDVATTPPSATVPRIEAARTAAPASDIPSRATNDDPARQV